jgi:hypothetical protein
MKDKIKSAKQNLLALFINKKLKKIDVYDILSKQD